MDVNELRHLLDKLRGEEERHLPVLFRDATGSLHDIGKVQLVREKFVVVEEAKNASIP